MQLRRLVSLATVTSIAIGALIAGTSVARAAIIDPGFDIQTASNGQEEFATGDVIGGGWTVNNVVTLYSGANSLGLTPHQGGNALLLRGSSSSILSKITGSVYQDVGVAGSQAYRLGFAVGAGANNGQGALLYVSVGFLLGGTFQDFSAASIATMNWLTPQFSFTTPPGATLARITFSGMSLNTSVDGPITLTAVPEPYQYGLVGVLGMLGFVGRQIASRKKSA